MTIEVSGLGPVLDLARALGIVGDDDQLDPAWFADPGGHVGRMLRDPGQRDALLRLADDLLAEGVPAEVDTGGRRWIEVVAEGPVAVYVVVTVTGAADAETTEVGIGAKVQSDDPDAAVAIYVPLLRVPASGPVAPAFDDADARVALDGEVAFGSEGEPGEPALAGIKLGAAVGMDGSAPLLAVTLLGLQLPGQDAPSDLSLDVDPSDLDALGDQAIRLVSGLVQRSVGGASGELPELLALLGLGDDTAIPALPLDALLSDGSSAWGAWLDSVLSSPAAIDAWLAHLAALAAGAAAGTPTIEPAAGPDLPHRVRWPLANGATVSAVVRTGRTAAGDLYVELGGEVALAAAGATDASLEASATFARIALGSTPTVTGLPALAVAGRLGPAVIADPADRLVNLPDPSARVGSLRAGLSLGENRRFGALLAAHDVEIGTHTYPVLDLTNPDTLADVAGDVVGDLADEILDLLGAAGDSLRVLLGVAAPPDSAPWPVELTPPIDLLADPIGAVLAYHRRVLDEHRDSYSEVLDALRELLAPAGFDVPISGEGTAEEPWRLVLADANETSLALEVWLDGERLELGIAFDQGVVDLGGGCPTATLRVLARIASIALDGSGGQALPGADASIVFGARGGVPLQLGDAAAAIVADSLGVELVWTPAAGLRGGLAVPGLAAVIDGETVPITLPEIGADGLPVQPLETYVPWRAVELLAGHMLGLVDTTWADELVRLLGWLPGAASAPDSGSRSSWPTRLARCALGSTPCCGTGGWPIRCAGLPCWSAEPATARPATVAGATRGRRSRSTCRWGHCRVCAWSCSRGPTALRSTRRSCIPAGCWPGSPIQRRPIRRPRPRSALRLQRPAPLTAPQPRCWPIGPTWRTGSPASSRG